MINLTSILNVGAPVPVIALQVVFMLAVPMGIGMAIRRRWPAWAQFRRVRCQKLAWVLLLLLLFLVFSIEAERVATMLGRTEFAVFGSIYFVTELPLMLAAAAVWRRRQPAPASPA